MQLISFRNSCINLFMTAVDCTVNIDVEKYPGTVLYFFYYVFLYDGACAKIFIETNQHFSNNMPVFKDLFLSTL